MDYDVSNLLDRIAKLERDVQQLQVSPRTGLFNSAYSAIAWDTSPSVMPDVANVFQNYSPAGPSVTLKTGTRALVLFGHRPTIQISTTKYSIVVASFAISGATTRAAGASGVARTSQDGVGFASAGMWSRDDQLQMQLVSNLNPGINTFTMMGMYSQAGSGTTINTIYNLNICVIPLDV